MINCSLLSPNTEETRSWQPNNKSTRGLAFNARTTLGRSPAKHSARSIQRNEPRSSASGNRSASSIPRNEPRLNVSPIGTRQSRSLSHFDLAIAQVVPSKGTSLA
ncbi:hypothetical protein Adt_37775 [Abeliophyllum distichum]|uniref:Uncharacterized protein n=1 Tax=Abeliophyllum distichum TaxID=126358 RepID=A0ABD1Q0D1_9LAMI